MENAQYACNTCSSIYSNKSALSKHIKTCAMKCGKLEHEVSYAELVKIVSQLTQKVHVLENVVSRLTLNSNKNVKKNTSAILEQLTISQSYFDWIEKISIDGEIMQHFIENNNTNI